MSVLTELKLYLLDKIERINVNNPKANSGGVMLKLYEGHEEEMDDMLMCAIQVMQSMFTRESVDSPPGEAALTNVSMKIGQFMFGYMDREPVTWKDELRLGDLFIEAFYNCGFIDIEYPKRRDSSHVVKVSTKWPRLSSIPDPNFDITLRDTYFSIEEIEEKEFKVKAKYGESIEVNPSAQYNMAARKLNSTPWRINERVFNALIEADGFTSHTKEKEKARELKRISKLIEWKFIKAKTQLIVNDGRDFYQTFFGDYRGRFYYDEPFINFQGSDFSRGLLQFAEPKLLREEDTHWLAVHTASSYNKSYGIDEIPDWCEADYYSYLKEQGLESISVDKMTLNDRVEWTQQNIDEIIRLGRECEFDTEAEKKVAFLAACIEWHDYTSCEGDYYSCLPIPIDGSNNGWQHLGAISKDPETGELVGLVPVEIQKDFYVQTAKELINQTTDERLVEILESMPMKHIRKGISKRGSMTRAYSAGAKKISDNMYFDCRVEDYHSDYGITEEDCNKFARLLIQAINVVCPGPLETMEYMQKLAAFEIGKFGVDPKLIKRKKELSRLPNPTSEELEELDEIVKTVKEQGEHLIYGNGKDEIRWMTPSGFEVVYQKWIMHNERCLATISGYRRVNHVVHMPSDKPDVRGFMCGISPNFIHSMDASHMAMVIDEWDGTFGAVHDSFSTHACDVDDLLALTKRKFVEMYDVDNFYNYIRDQIVTDQTDIDVEQPQLGSLQIQEIYNSDYFFA